MQPGDTFLLPGQDDHLWLVISDADSAGRVIVVCLLSWQPQYDQACVLNSGDHPFIKHATCVQYVTARLVPLATLEAKERDGSLRPKAPLGGDLLSRIQAGAAAGDINTECYAVLRGQGRVP
jgi:hypothetical protein